ncbi:hypothetical protein GRI33_06195 [Brucella sp. BO3]|uniref:hypothetical protein n=1 Tax=unclassified Brucella TaxID=2632610 RepID=UPI00084F9B6F|nr:MULTISPECIES: hypothetical protein [unclassified Brucella]OEI83706.1 hypothetical protein BA060_06935 [Brucella sp. B13-0095]QMV26540.1 hypothetical protein GRI33_06195 [Brucella sp. BO3]
MKPLSENPAILDPKHALSRSERQALLAIARFRSQRQMISGRWLIGNKRFEAATIDGLLRSDLVKRERVGLDLTLGGKLVHDKISGARHGSR